MEILLAAQNQVSMRCINSKASLSAVAKLPLGRRAVIRSFTSRPLRALQ